MLSVRIVSVDYYMAQPLKDLDLVYSQFRGTEVKQVPVIRIFGSNSVGQKVCLHVHGVFPYLYIPHDTSSCDADKFMYQIANSIDKSLNITLRNTNSSAQHVYKVTQVKGIPFYGYHPKEHKFFKIYLYNPAFIRKAGDLLQNASILGQVYQPHETHIPYILQFFIDYNLFGMSYINIAKAKYRQGHNHLNISEDEILPKTISKTSKSEIEIDCLAMDILNRNEIISGNLAINPGLAAIWENERTRNKIFNMTESEESQRPAHKYNTKSEIFFKNHLKQTLIDKDAHVESLSDTVLSYSLSSDKTEKFNMIYPDENDDKSLMNASLIDNNLNKTDCIQKSKITLDDDDNKLLCILKDLEENGSVEDDSILGTQCFVKSEALSNENEDETIVEDEHDLSMALSIDVLDAEQNKNNSSQNIWETSFWSTITDKESNKECNSNRPTQTEKRASLLKSRLMMSENDINYTSQKIKEETKNTTNHCDNKQFIKDCSTLINKFKSEGLAITLKKIPLTRNELLSSLDDYKISETISIFPFYSNPKDVTSRREIGHLTLKISANIVNDLEEFQTCSNLELHKWRTEAFKELNLTNESVSINAINVFLASESKCAITPLVKTPTAREVANWLKARDLLKERNLEEKFNKTHVIHSILKYAIPNSPSDGVINCSLNSSLKLSPCTPLSHDDSNPVDCTCSQIEVISEKVEKSIKKNIRKSKRKLFHLLMDNSKNSEHQFDTTLHPENNMSQQNEDDSSNDTVNLLLEQSDFVRGLISPVGNSSNSNFEDTVIGLNNTHAIQMGEKNFKQIKTISDHQFLTLLCLELHIQTRQDYKPDPEIDPIRAVFYAITNDVPEDSEFSSTDHGIIVVDFIKDNQLNSENNLNGIEACTENVIHTKNEHDLIQEVIKLITKWDPDILAGYEIEMLSWGFLIQRSTVLGINFTKEIHRASSMNRDEKQWGDDNKGVITVIGRIMLDIWRLLRHEVSLTNYTFENVMYNILQQRVPMHSFKSLTFWWEHPTSWFRWIVVEYYLLRVKGIIKLLDQLDLIGRTCELARLFGIQFYDVLSRGSQFRVESMMLRLAKPLNYVAVSPSVQQRAHMRAPEFLPLILEPESRFYSDPVIVLDFQSLYPSMIIAYNYCFSTCLGRVEHLGKSSLFEFGASQLKVSKNLLQDLVNKDNITVSPCGVAFVNKNVRLGILPRMLQEILDTRLMVKKSMKQNTENKVLQRLLHSQQLGLKLIANVTYGYTAANFSGRMPCIEVGDSVVAKGRETLERAIQLVERTAKWRAKVVYGDTDSLFVLIPGRSRECAFEIGTEIAEAVTKENPYPVKLKLEKVYQPCILQTKKRYVGYMYENPSQTEPTYEAKGIETVRRDGCPVVAKTLEKSLRILFGTYDVSKVKSYVVKKFQKILNGEISLQDLIFAKEFRGLHSYKPGACVPALVLARNWMIHDKRSEPRRGERVPYVIINGLPNTPLIQLVRSPYDLLRDPGLRINALYYITRVIIPPLNRCLLLIGANAHEWFAEMPRITKQYLPTLNTASCLASKKSTVSQYFSIEICISCGIESKNGICDDCANHPQKTCYVLNEKIRCWERTLDNIQKVCKSCCYRHDQIDCISLDCPTVFQYKKAERNHQQTLYIRSMLEKFF